MIPSPGCHSDLGGISFFKIAPGFLGRASCTGFVKAEKELMMALGKVLELSCRLNVYVRHPDGHVKAITADGWGFSQVTGRKCLIVRDNHSKMVHVLGHVVRRGMVPPEELATLNRVKVVEESITSSGRSEWDFFVEEVNEETRGRILRGPIVEPSSIVGGGIRL
jgi:hypothetical protein